jgi:hypothetical protein
MWPKLSVFPFKLLQHTFAICTNSTVTKVICIIKCTVWYAREMWRDDAGEGTKVNYIGQALQQQALQNKKNRHNEKHRKVIHTLVYVLNTNEAYNKYNLFRTELWITWLHIITGYIMFNLLYIMFMPGLISTN